MYMYLSMYLAPGMSLNYVTYTPVKFEVTVPNGLGEDAFTRKYIIGPWCQSHMKCCPVPSTSCELCTCKV